MGFRPGVSGNPAGRPVGTKNTKINKQRVKMTCFVIEQWPMMVRQWEEMSARNQWNFYLAVMQYVVPKLSTITTETRMEDLRDDQIDEILNKLL